MQKLESPVFLMEIEEHGEFEGGFVYLYNLSSGKFNWHIARARGVDLREGKNDRIKVQLFKSSLISIKRVLHNILHRKELVL